MTVELGNGDKDFLGRCPQTIIIGKHPTRIDAAKMKRVRRLWQLRLVKGDVGNDGQSLKVTLTNAGRLAIGRPVIDAPIEGDTDAHA